MPQVRRIDQYELLEIVGQGEILTTYRARDTERDRLAVLKMVQPHLRDDAGLIDRFRREAEALTRLRHPHIVPVHAANIAEDAVYLVADAPAGESLERRLAGHGPLEVDDVLSIALQVAEALDYAHEQGVLHHDLRPANIYLADKTAVLTDFHLLESVGATPVYMAPEQLDETSAETADRRSDAYALGVIIYEMLTGRPPFTGTAADVAAAHLTQRPTPPRVHNPELLPALDAILLKALAKQPQSRYQTAGELATRLHEAVQVAQTRRMADNGMFDSKARMAGGTGYKPSSSDSEGSVPAWVWVGLGILLVVVAAVVILLVTS
jgi:serine/threonine protein kinase